MTQSLAARHVVIHAYGPSGVTKSALKRAKGLVSDDGAVVVVSAHADADTVVSRLGGRADACVTGAHDDTTLAAAIEELPDGLVIALHDDLTLDAAAIDASISATSDAPNGVALLATKDAPVGCAIGDRDALARAVASGAMSSPSDGLITLTADIRHDGRCTPHVARPLLVATMIVRDEEQMLPDCLASLDGLVDEIVIADTGSTDRTVEIAKAAGATVLTHEWNDDFSEAREAVRIAALHARFALWIDADERVVTPNHDRVRTMLDDSDRATDCWAVDIVSVRSSGPSTRSTAQRLYRPDRLEYVGAIHEELRLPDGSQPTTATTDLVTLTHVGYDEETVALRDKPARNLAIARGQHEREPSPKTALDLARSIAYAGGDLTEAIGVLDALDGEACRGVVGEQIRATKAGLQLDTGNLEDAFATARAASEIGDAHDVTAAVLAVTAAGLGRDEELVALGGRLLEPPEPQHLTVGRNRLQAMSLAAAGCARSGATPLARELIALVHRDHTTTPDDAGDAWATVADAFADVEPPVLRTILIDDAPWPVEPVLDALETRLGTSVRHQLQPPTGRPKGGITLSFGGPVLPVDAEAFLATTPPGRRVLEWTGDQNLVNRLRSHSLEVHSLDPDADLVEALGDLADGDRCFDVAIGGVGTPETAAALRGLIHVLDPSGIVRLWAVDEGGVPLPTVSQQARDHIEAVKNAGYAIDRTVPDQIVGARPPWQRVVATDEITTATVVVVSDEPLPDQLRTAYRMSLPTFVNVTFDDATEPVDASAIRLVTTPDIIPEPGWVQRLWDGVNATGSPVGARVVGRSGLTDHAGSIAGKPVFQGTQADLPPVMTSRRSTDLLPPYMTPDAAEPSSGMLDAAAVAMTLHDSPVAGAGAAAADVFARTVVMVGGDAPGSDGRHDSEALEKAVTRLCEAGLTPVYQWRPGLAPDPITLMAWRRRGVVAIPPPVGDGTDDFRPDAHRPEIDALVRTFRPEAVVYLDLESLGNDYVKAAGHQPNAVVIYVGDELPADIAGRPDRRCGLDELAEEILAACDEPLPTTPVSIPRIQPVETTNGLTSIVIPVFNNHALTVACLESLARHTDRPYEVVVVDNGSTDETASGFGSLDVSVIRNDENRGFPAAVNQGIAAARGEFVCVLNNDTEATPGWLDALHAALAREGTGLVGPRSNDIAGLQKAVGAPPMSDTTALGTWTSEWVAAHRGQTWEIAKLVGFCLLGRRDLFEQVGGFDEGFGIGNYEDDELCDRVKESGRTLRVADDAIVLHHGSATFRKMRYDYAALIHTAARHLPERQPAVVPVAAVILSDGNGASAAIAATTARRLADRVRIAERQGLIATELAAGAVRGGGVEVIDADWATDEGGRAALEGLNARAILVIGSKERVDGTDWGSARAELEAHLDEPAQVSTAGGNEVRLVPTSLENPSDVIGTRNGTALRTIRFV